MSGRRRSSSHVKLTFALLLTFLTGTLQSFAPTKSWQSTRTSRTRTRLEMLQSLREQLNNTDNDFDSSIDWQDSDLDLSSKPYVSLLLESHPAWTLFLKSLPNNNNVEDPLWEGVKLEALEALEPEPEAGPQLYQGIISQPSLLDAIVTIVSHEIETELIPATALKNLCLEMLSPDDDISIHLDTMAAAMRSRSIGSALTAMLFHKGLHALVCYRVGHRLWLAGRTGLAYYMQSTVSRKYSADIHPASRLGSGLYLNCGSGVVIGETAVVGQDVTILQGVTLGGTGKEAGDRHPKVGNGVILQDGATVLGNIKVGDGSIIEAKSIVTKPVPPLAIVSGVPATVRNYRQVTEAALMAGVDVYEQHLGFKYMHKWQELTDQRRREEEGEQQQEEGQ